MGDTAIKSFSDSIINTLSGSLGIWYIIILNAFGVLAIFLKTAEFQFKKRIIIQLLATFANCCWIAYFALQGDLVSAIANTLGVIKMIVFTQKGKKKWANGLHWLLIFAGLQIALGVLTFRSWHDAFPIIGGVLDVCAYYCLSQKRYRYFALASIAFWVLNGIFKLYYIALVNDVLALISSIIGIIRFELLMKKADKVQDENTNQTQTETQTKTA